MYEMAHFNDAGNFPGTGGTKGHYSVDNWGATMTLCEPSLQPGELLDVERSTTPTAPMNLLLRFETINGPRTVIASSVPLQTAREVADAMIRAGQHAEFVDRCTALSVADRQMMKKLQQLPVKDRPKARRERRRATEEPIAIYAPAPLTIAAE